MRPGVETDPTAPLGDGDDRGEARQRAATPAVGAADHEEGRRGGAAEVTVGSRLGRYEVMEVIGEGGMATVFRGRDPELRRDVAIKVLFPHLARRKEVVARFQREARAAARLRHPAILQTYDVGGGERGEPPYIVMELVRGGGLHEHLAAHGPLLSEVVACVGVVVAEALAVAHDAGVIHRDLKPANLLIADDGRLLLADFGVARVEREDSLATRTGAVLGTPAYMSPEQAQGEHIDARSDVYSLGATLYHLATGAVPYAGPPMKVLAQLATPGALVAPDQRRPAVGRALAQVIARLMAHDADQRPQRARDAAAQLGHLAATLGEPAEQLRAYLRAPAEYVAACTPEVVAALLDEARRARSAGKLAAAIAVADRAHALAPDDAAVQALVREVTSRHQRARVPRWLGGAAAVVALAAALAWWAARTDEGLEPSAAAGDAGAWSPVDGGAAASAPVVIDAAVARASTPDAAPADRGAPRPSVSDRGPTQVSRARPPGGAPPSGGPSSAAGEPAVSPAVDADVPAAAAPPPLGEPAPRPATGRAYFAMDAWCELVIDGERRGRAERGRAVSLSPGRHVAECSQGPGLGQWRGDVVVPADGEVLVRGELRVEVVVPVEVSGSSVLVDGVRYENGAVARLHNGRHRVSVRRGERELAGGWVSIPRVTRCTLRDRPVLDCFP